jgi:hypothetical protein
VIDVSSRARTFRLSQALSALPSVTDTPQAGVVRTPDGQSPNESISSPSNPASEALFSERVGIGTRNRTRVPSPGPLSTISFPPRATVRSCMLLSPIPAGVSGANPRPSSDTSASMSSSFTPRLTQTFRAPEWRRALVSAFCKTRISSVPASPRGVEGNAPATSRCTS